MSALEKVAITAEVDADLRDELKEIADQNERSLAAEVRLALRNHVRRFRAEED